MTAAFRSGAESFPLNTQRLFQDPTNGFGRIQTAVWILKHHLGALGVMDDLSVIVVDHTQDRAGQGGLAAAGLAHKADDLTLRNGKGDVVKHLTVLALLTEEGAPLLIIAVQVPHFQYRFC